MAIFKYYLEKRKDKEGEIITKNVPIIYSFSFDGYRIKTFSGERIDSTLWDNVKQRVTGGKNRIGINQRLEALQSKIEKVYRDGKVLDENVTPNYIRAKLTTIKHEPKSINVYFEEFIKVKKSTLVPNSLKAYTTTSNHLKEYFNKKRVKISFNEIDEKFYNSFVNYMIEDVGLTNNTVNKLTKNLKSFLKWALEQGYHQNENFRRFSYKENESEIFVLDWAELMHLYNLEIEKEYLKQVRDIFCFGCFTSLRYSDIFNLKKNQILNDIISIRVQKTKEVIQIPLNKYSKAILEKYSNIQGDKCLPVISNQKMNEYLKIVGDLAGMKSIVTRVKYKGNERIEEHLPKYEILTTHIARKTFITNAFRLNIPVEVIMQISGHKDHKVFKRYNKIAQEQVKTAMEKFNSFN
jgi:integrase